MRVTHTGKTLSEALIFPATNPKYDKRLFMNNLLSYCGLVVGKISASDKDLPVCVTLIQNNF